MDHEWKFLGFEPMATQSHNPSAEAGRSSFRCETCGMEAKVGRIRKSVKVPPTLEEIRASQDPNEELFSGAPTDVTCQGEAAVEAAET